ncbi:MAG: cytidine deaminase [TACK group archaeon]|nr:cytidine deaminase [TACK group archaeon]
MDEEDEILLETAKKAAMKAYAPYSKFKVGAALMASDGSIYTGCNVENSSYGLSMCAERVALFKAVSEGKREFLAIAVMSDSGPVTPCGACRQVLFEFSPNIRVLTEGQEHSLSELLPHAFSLQDGHAPR